MTLPAGVWTPEVTSIRSFKDWVVTMNGVIEPDGEDFDLEVAFSTDNYATMHPIDSYSLDRTTNVLSITH